MRLQRQTLLAYSAIACALVGTVAPSWAEPATTSTDPSLVPASASDKKKPGLGKAATLDVSKPYGFHLQPILDKIKADDQQRKRISEIVASYKTKIQPLRDDYKVKRQEFLSSMFSGGAAETIMSRQMELSHLSSDITSKYCMMRLEIRRALSPQQILLYESYSREQGWNR